MAKFNVVTEYKIKASAVTPFHIGSSDGTADILLDSEYKPYIQANSIAGAFGDYCESIEDINVKKELFGGLGKYGSKSKITFSDGIIKMPGTDDDAGVKTELRPRVRINSRMGVAENENLHNIQLIGAGIELEFKIRVFDEKFVPHTEKLIAAFKKGEILLGGQKTNGCGKFSLTYAGKMVYDLTKEKGLKAWLDSNPEYKKVELDDVENGYYNITMPVEIENSLMIKGVATLSKNINKFVNSESIKNADDKYIVMGSSLKGVIKNHIYSIADYLEIKGNIISEIFGREGIKNSDNGIMGKVIFEDAEIIGNNTEKI